MAFFPFPVACVPHRRSLLNFDSCIALLIFLFEGYSLTAQALHGLGLFCIRKTVARACVQRLCLVVGDAAYSVKRLTRTTRNIATAKPMLMKLARSTKTFCTSESLA